MEKHEEEIKLTEEKSLEVAGIIESMKGLIHFLDTEYCQALVNGLRRVASKQDSMLILNPSYDFRQTELLEKQADALQHLVDYIADLKKADELKRAVAEGKSHREKINKLFL